MRGETFKFTVCVSRQFLCVSPCNVFQSELIRDLNPLWNPRIKSRAKQWSRRHFYLIGYA